MSEYTTPVSGRSGLDDAERALLLRLAIRTIAAQTGDPLDATADILDEFARDGLVSIRHDQVKAVLTAGDRVVVVERNWLRFMAHRAMN